MPSQLTDNGLQIAPLSEVVEQLASSLTAIYGQINLNPNSPDGQWVNILARATRDYLELLAEINNSFDPDQATGRVLDSRCALNNVTRSPGDYTYIDVTVTFSANCDLAGLDSNPTSPFTLSDSVGNKYFLVNRHVNDAGAGDTLLTFRAENMGDVDPDVGSITVINTPVSGVASVTNPAKAQWVGVAEESDVSLRLRRARYVAAPARSWYEALYAMLMEYGVRDVKVYENYTNVTDVRGVPGHSIWVLIDDTDLQSDIAEVRQVRAAELANVIYIHKNAGCGFKPAVQSDPADPEVDGHIVNVRKTNGQEIVIQFDIPAPQELHIRLNATPLPGSPTVNAVWVKEAILNYFGSGAGRYRIGQTADSSAIVAYLKSLAPGIVFHDVEVSNNGSAWSDQLDPDTNGRWVLDAARITVTT